MSGSDLRPLSYGWVDKNNSNSYAATPELPEATNGYPDLAIPPAKKYNHTMQRHAGWIAHLDGVAMRSDQILGDTSVNRLSQYPFRFLNGAGLTQSVADDSTYIIDGFIVDLALTRLGIEGYTPFLFTASKWTHWYISKDGVTFEVVNIGVAASPPAGSYHLGTAVTDGVDVTSWVAGNAAFTDRTVTFTPDVKIVGDVQMDNALTVDGESTFNEVSTWVINSASPAISLANAGTGGGIHLTSAANGPAAMISLIKSNGFDGTLLSLAAIGNGPSRCISATGGDGDSTAYLAAGSGQLALEIQGNVIGTYAARFKGGLGQSWVAYFEAGAGGVSDSGGVLVTGAGLGTAIGASGGTSAGAYAIQALARNSTAQGAIFAQTHTTATFVARAGYFQGRDQAGGVEAVSAGYYPLLLTPDTTSPTYGHIYGAPQNAAPTQPTSGSMAYVASTINGWGQGDSTDGAFRWFHSSCGGYVYGGLYAQVATSNSSVSYSNLAVVDCVGANAPKVVGQKVRISVKLRFRCNTSGVATGIDIKVIDFTAASAEVIKFEASGTGTGNGLHLMATTTNWSESFSFETDYTIPSPAGDRTFILQIRRWGAIAISAQGSMTVDGV